MSRFLPFSNAYPQYGNFQLPGMGIDTKRGPLANHLVFENGEANEMDYTTESGYRTSNAMYEFEQTPFYRSKPRVPIRPIQGVGVGRAPPFDRVPKGPENSVLDFNFLQGTNNPTDLSTQVLLDINYRYVTLQNSSYRPIGIGITTYFSGTVPSIRFVVHPEVIRYLGINSQGGPAQFIWPLDPQTGKQVGSPQILAANANDFILRDGLNGWTVQNFQRPSYRASF